nr:QWRF motif-containing protein 3-like [Tanacetum cinerariifolium]
MLSDQTQRHKSREVSSRYLSPPSPLPNVKTTSTTTKPKQKHKHTGFIRGFWPSTKTHASKSHNENDPTTNTTTLADHLKRSEKTPFFNKKNSLKDNNMNRTPLFGTGTMKHAGKMMFQGRTSVLSSTSSSSSTKSSDMFESNQVILPGRLSVDENALRRKPSYYKMRSDSFSDSLDSSDLGSPISASYMAPTLSSSKFKNSYLGMHSKSGIKRGQSLSPRLEWESSPSRMGLGSPSFSSLKPPMGSVTRGKKDLMHMGLDLIKGKKGGSKLNSNSVMDSSMNMENVYQLRLFWNSWMQWRYANARAQVAQKNIGDQCEHNLLYASESISKLRQSVLQKRLQLQKEKLEMKLNLILHSQMKMLEAWGDIERRHIVDVSALKDYLHAAVCMIPLIEGAKVDVESATMAFQQTSHLVATIKSMVSTFSPMAHDTLSELAAVTTQEKLLLEECFEHLRLISILEIQESNLRCSIMAMDSLNEQQHQTHHM